jgi:glutamate synthase domain-containing protein 2
MQKQVLNIFEKKLADALREADDVALAEGRAIWAKIGPAPSCPFVRDVMRHIQHVLARGHVAREHVLMKLVSETIASYATLLSSTFNENLMDVISKAFPRDHYIQFAKNTQDVYKRRAIGQNKKFDEKDFVSELTLISVSASSMSNQTISRAHTLIEEASIKKIMNTQSLWKCALRLFWEFIAAPMFKWVSVF